MIQLRWKLFREDIYWGKEGLEVQGDTFNISNWGTKKE